MADLKALKSGNWSDPTVGLNGATAADRVFSNNFTVIMDVDVTVASFHNGPNATIGAASGGRFDAAANRVITGNSYAEGGICLYTTQIGTTFIGNFYAGSGTSYRALQIDVSGSVTTVIGDSFGGGGTGSHGVLFNSTGVLEYTGNATGGVSTVGNGVLNNSTGRVNHYGNATGGTGSAGAKDSVIGSYYLHGIAIASSLQAGFDGSGQNSYIKGAEFHVTSKLSPFTGSIAFLPNPTMKIYLESGAVVVLTDPASSQDFPSVNNVRNGVTYKNGTMTGTCKVPPPAAVSLGVEVDHTTGTAMLTALDLLNAIEGADHPMADRLRNVSTWQSIGAQLEQGLQN